MEDQIYNRLSDINTHRDSMSPLINPHEALGEGTTSTEHHLDTQMLIFRSSTMFLQTGEESHLNDIIKIIDTLTVTDSVLPSVSMVIPIIYEKFCRTLAPRDLDRAVTLAEKVVAVAPPYHPDRSSYVNNLNSLLEIRRKWLNTTKSPQYDLDTGVKGIAPLYQCRRACYVNNLGRLYSAKHDQLGNLSDLWQAIGLGTEAIAMTTPQNPQSAGYLRDLCRLYTTRYDRLANHDDLNLAIESSEQALEMMSINDSKRPESLSYAYNLLWRRYKISQDQEDLNRAITLAEEELATTCRAGSQRRHRLDNTAVFFGARYNYLQDINDLNRLIELRKEGLAIAPLDDVDRQTRLRNTSILLGIRYKRSKVLEELDHAIKLSETALAISIPGDPSRPECLDILSTQLAKRHKRLGGLSDLDRAIQMCKETLPSASLDNTDYSGRLQKLSKLLVRRYEYLGAQQDLDRSIEVSQEALAAALSGSKIGRKILFGLTSSLSIRYDHKGDVKDLQRAIELEEAELDSIPLGDINRPARLNNLSIHLGKLYENQKDLAILQSAINVGKEAHATAPVEDINRACIAHNLSASFSIRYTHLKDLNDLDLAIRLSEEGLRISHPDDPGRPPRRLLLSQLLRLRYQHLETLEDLERAIELDKEELASPIGCGASQWETLLSLCKSFFTRYRKLGFPEDLQQAIKLGQQAIITVPSETERHEILINLVALYYDLYDNLNTLSDLERAIELGEVLLALAPPGDTSQPRILDRLGSHLVDRYERLGAIEDLGRAIDLSEKALATISPDCPEWPSLLFTLSNRLGMKYYRLGTITDLERAIELDEKFCDTTPTDHPKREIGFSNFSSNLAYRYQRLGAIEDLERGIRLLEEVITIGPRNILDRPMHFHKLSGLLLLRYYRLERLEDLYKAIKLSKEAVAQETSISARQGYFGLLSALLVLQYNQEGSVESLKLAITLAEDSMRSGYMQPEILAHLSNCIYDRYKLTKDPQDLARSIELAEQAVAKTPTDHSRRSSMLITLGNRVSKRFKNERTFGNLLIAARSYINAYNCISSPPSDRISAAYKALSIMGQCRNLKGIIELARGVVLLLPQVAPRSLRRTDQEFSLSQFPGRASVCAALALFDGADALECLSFLEHGRGIIMGLVIDCRSDLSLLQSQHADIAEQFKILRTELDTPTDSRLVDTNPPRQQAQNIRKMEDILIQIRKLPGFERFQLPPSRESLMDMASEGAIVILNCAMPRTDAIIVTASNIQVLPLPGVEYKETDMKMQRIALELTHGKRSTYSSRNQEMKELLRWLWDVMVEPVLMKLGICPKSPNTELPGGELPRIWWIGVGILSMAPFHAAGYHSPGSTRNTLSHVISSYIPTIKALSYARGKQLDLGSSCSRLLLVSMPETPDAAPLHNATREIERIIDVVQAEASIIRLDSPSRNQVLEELPSCHVVHFACHGISDSVTPSNSRLLLLRRSESGDNLSVDHLTVGNISDINIKNAQIAYLSACWTASTSQLDLLDESIHIATGFQLAGFSHVLATRWDSNDDACQRVASDFYRRLFDGSGGGHERVSRAFHHAVKMLRDKYWRQPLKWAPFIHTGA